MSSQRQWVDRFVFLGTAKKKKNTIPSFFKYYA